MDGQPISPPADAPAFIRLTWMRERFAEGYSLEEIGAALGATPRDIRQALKRAGIDPDVRPLRGGEVEYAPPRFITRDDETDIGAGRQVKARQHAFDQLKSSESLGTVMDEVLEVLGILGRDSDAVDASREGLSRQVRILAHQRGTAATRHALLVLAAHALKFASRLKRGDPHDLSADRMAA